jgi:hypothetical protein
MKLRESDNGSFDAARSVGMGGDRCSPVRTTSPGR